MTAAPKPTSMPKPTSTPPRWAAGRAAPAPDGVVGIEAAGILLVGDPHLASRRPGRRRDADFVATSVGKLRAAIEIANARRLVPVILGDIVDLGDANEMRLLVGMTRTLRSAWTVPFYNRGNHTLTIERRSIHQVETDRHTISLLTEAGTLRAMTGDGSPDLLVRTADGDVAVGAVAYGRAIPARADASWAFAGEAMKVLVTHHDLSFPGRPIPGSAPLKRIAGIDLVVNGHVHDRRPPVLSGKTWWFNPGNILRLSIDLEGHVPTVYALGPGEAVAGRDEALPYGLSGHAIAHDPDAFDHTGMLVEPAGPGQATIEATPSEAGSAFVSILQSEVSAPRTEDGSVLDEEIGRICEEREVPDDVRSIVAELAHEARDPNGPLAP